MRWAALVVVLGLVVTAIWLVVEEDVIVDGAPLPPPGFVGSKTCRTCHEGRFDTWLRTAHAYALRDPDEESVAGRFDGTPVDAPAFTATPYQRDGDYFIRVDPKDRRQAGEHRITRVVGRTFEQAYLFTGPRGEWRVLPICWSLERKEWDLTHDVLDDIAGHQGSLGQGFDTRQVIFNHGCGQCHATNYDVGHAEGADGTAIYSSTLLEGAVACESCHGPGATHAAWHEAERGADDDYVSPARLINPRRDLNAREILESCGRCHYNHEWRFAIDADPRRSHHDVAVGRNFDQQGFFADGRLSGLAYHGTTQSQSACYVKGEMSCLSCHRMHGGKRWAMKWEENDDAQCTQCHDQGKYQGRAHTHHDDTRCVDCHMPKFIQKPGVLNFLRDHSIRSPEPELTEQYGKDNSPNACNVCHGDKTATWGREWKEKWWGPAPRAYVDAVGAMVALRRDPAKVATQRLAAIVTDPAQRLFFRTTAARELAARSDEDARAVLLELLSDTEPELLQIACEAQATHADPPAAPALVRLLKSPVRTVRVEAAYALARGGWRGEAERAFKDAVLMLDRQFAAPRHLERIVYIADAVGDFKAMDRYLQQLMRSSETVVIDLPHRRARRLIETGHHLAALQLLEQVRDLMPRDKPLPASLYIDSCDSLAAIDQLGEATRNWRYLVTELDENDPLRTIARARVLAVDGKRDEARRVLTDLDAKLAADPWSGEVRRRVRWSLDAIR